METGKVNKRMFGKKIKGHNSDKTGVSGPNESISFYNWSYVSHAYGLH